jgi:hypothetical protein
MIEIKPLPSVERLRQLFNYNPDTGKLTRKIRKKGKGARVGVEPGHRMAAAGRRTISIDNGQYYAARVIWKIYYGIEPICLIDHINRDSGDDRIINLRDISPKINCNNRSYKAREPVPGLTSLLFM